MISSVIILTDKQNDDEVDSTATSGLTFENLLFSFVQIQKIIY